MSDEHEYPPCTGQCCHGLALATDRLTAAQEQLYAKRDELQAANADLGAARQSLEVVHEFIAFIGETYETSNLPSEGKITRCRHCRHKVDGNVGSPMVCDKLCLGRRARALLTPPVPAPPPCASWCGGATSMLPPQRTLWFNDGKNENPIFCTEACRDAGAPRNPAQHVDCDCLARGNSPRPQGAGAHLGHRDNQEGT